MAQPIAPDYGQQFLLPPALEDWVPKDHPVRFIREFVDQQDLAKLGFAMPIALEGRPPYAPGLLLKIWLYGYHQRLRSTRKLEAACRDQLPLIWLTAMIVPDHNSLWRFWRDNKKALRQLFKQSVRLALKAGLVGLVLQAVDGTKIQAAASSRSGWTREQMQKLLRALDGEIAEAEKQLEQEGAVPEGTGYGLPPQLQERQALREAVKAGLEQLEQDGRSHYHPNEPEARRMKCEGTRPFAYNAQAVVDQSHGVVVAAEVTIEEQDSAQLVGMVEQAQQNTGVQRLVLTVADGSYGSGAQIAEAAERQLDVLVQPQEGGSHKEKGYSARDFKYDSMSGTVTCPQKRQLEAGREIKQKGQWVKRYCCRAKDCPVAQQCQDPRGRRVIEIWRHTAAVQAMRERLAQAQAQQQLCRRGEIIERHFGQIKQHEGFRRWTVGGADNVRTQWALLNLIGNLRVLYTHWSGRKPNADKKRAQSAQCLRSGLSRTLFPSTVVFPAASARWRSNRDLW
jgi:transposase